MAPEHPDLTQLNPLAGEKMQITEVSLTNPEGSIIYRSGIKSKIQRNPSTPLGTQSLSKGFEVFTPCDFIAAITQHIQDNSFQLVRYYGWHSNKMRGQRG